MTKVENLKYDVFLTFALASGYLRVSTFLNSMIAII